MSEQPDSMTTSRVIRFVVVGLALVASLVYVAVTFDWPAIGAALAGADVGLLAIGGSSTIVAYFVVRTLRWAVVLRGAGVRIPFLSLYRWSVFSQAAIVVTPFQSGEVLKIEMLKAAGFATRMEGYGGLVVERVADVSVLVSIAALAVLWNLDRLLDVSPGVWFVAVLGVVAAFFLLVAAGKRFGVVAELVRSASGVARQPGILAGVVGLTFVAWSIVAVGWLLCFRSVGVVVSIGEALGLVAAVTLVNVASLVPGAVGISEVGISACLVRLGQAPALAQTGAMVIRAYALEVLVLAALHALAWRVLDGRSGSKDAAT